MTLPEQNARTAQWNLQAEFHHRFNYVMAPIVKFGEANVFRRLHKGQWRYTCPGNRLNFRVELRRRLRELAEWIDSQGWRIHLEELPHSETASILLALLTGPGSQIDVLKGSLYDGLPEVKQELWNRIWPEGSFRHYPWQSDRHSH